MIADSHSPNIPLVDRFEISNSHAGPDREDRSPQKADVKEQRMDLQEDYEFTSDWFSWNIDTWKRIFATRSPPSDVVEIGCYEGRATVWIIENLMTDRDGLLVAVDTWEEGPEDDQKGMKLVEARFDQNMRIITKRHPGARIDKRKGQSPIILSDLLARGARCKFDFIYVDGNHQTPDVLTAPGTCFSALQSGWFDFLR